MSCSKDEVTSTPKDETTSNSKEELTPEITFPTGTTNYFISGINFDNRPNTKTISFTSNVPWSASVDDTRDGSTWCTVNPAKGEAGESTFKISVKENTTYENRNAVIRLKYGNSTKNIFVNQKQLDALTLTSNRFEIPVGGGSATVEVKSNIKYQVKIDEDCKGWIHQIRTPTTRGLSASSLTFKIDPSSEYDKREGHIEIVSDNMKEVITIYQAGEGILTLTQKEFNLSSSEQDIAIEVSSNFKYSVTFPQVDWITENNSKTRAVSTHTINLHIKNNPSYSNRNATLRIYDKNSNLYEDVIINQSQLNALHLSKKEYSFDENGGTFKVDVNSNIDYKVNIGDSWVAEEMKPFTRALVVNTHMFRVEEMTGKTAHETKITFWDENTGMTDEIIVKQKNTFFFKNSDLDLTAGETTQLTLINESGIKANWKSSDNTIVTVDNYGTIKAIGKGTVTITASTTDGKHKCECHVTVKDITDFISVFFSGGVIMSNTGLIIYGSSLNWSLQNNSNSTVILKSLQLIDGQTGKAGNELSTNSTEVAAGETVGYSIRVGLAGIHIPVICKYKYEYKGKIYTTEAVYK